ncbi:MAG: Ig-like domain-containing protein [Bacteroidales bacterium]|jgi:hypothetical protein|nr:Ig-like domain-containing protein [Bacteroidales bacterium]
MPLTQAQIENIQIDYGIVYVNFGVAGEALLGPTRGGGTFDVKASRRDIEYDGMKGKSKGMQVIDDINAMLSVTILDTTIDTLAMAMPFATLAAGALTCEVGAIGVVPDADYLTNVTMFAKVVAGGYKRITLYNAMNEKDFSLSAAPKSEGEIALEISAHWDPTDDTVDLYKIEDVASIGGDVTGPTVVTVPADAAVAVVVGANLTATFNEDIKAADINSDNLVLMKAADGSIVAGALSYAAATKVATFDPAAPLGANTPYIWLISNVRDTAGNKMTPVVVNFTTA